ncbi:oligosaccharide flippase family protein [Saccharicrinis aurantiacus]|uniref:oligosaccharide flippase family protein n=1 Tax=Saccharicrinis aurantiacus TaxID=1849719 RepID=UPI0009500375|nr:oligosaccharide flippase family protein [Saccharicrinis aurantiacus]
MSNTFKQFKLTVIQSFFYSLGNFAGKFSGIILLPIYSFYLPIEEFGLYALFEAIFQVFQVFSGLGIKLGLSRWYWDQKEEQDRKSLFFTTFVFNSIVCILLSIIIYFSFNLLSDYYFKSPINSSLALLFVVGNLIRLFTEVPMLLLRIQHKAKRHSVLQVIQLLSFVAFVAVFLAIFDLGLYGIFWATIFSFLIQTLLLLPDIFRNIFFKIEWKKTIEMLRYGFPVALGNMVNVAFAFTDKYFINIFSNLKQVGTFTLSHKISNVVNLLVVNSFISAYMHSYFKTVDSSDSDSFFSRSFTYFYLVISFFSLLIILFIDELVLVLTANNEQYGGSSAIIPVLTIGLIFGGVRQMLLLPINKVKKTKVIGIVSVVAGAINVLLNYLLIPEWKALGAAYATGIVQLLSALTLLYFTLKYVKMKFEWLRLLLLTIAFVFCVSLGYLIQVDSIIISILIKVSIVALWMGLLLVSRFLLPEELLRIKQFWAKWSKKLPFLS